MARPNDTSPPTRRGDTPTIESYSGVGTGYTSFPVLKTTEEVINTIPGHPERVEDYVACIIQQAPTIKITLEGPNGEDRAVYRRYTGDEG